MIGNALKCMQSEQKDCCPTVESLILLSLKDKTMKKAGHRLAWSTKSKTTTNKQKHEREKKKENEIIA